MLLRIFVSWVSFLSNVPTFRSHSGENVDESTVLRALNNA